MNAVGGRGSSRRSRRPRRRLRFSPRKHGGAVLLALGLAGSALAFGAQHTLPLLLAALTACGAAVLLSPARTPRSVWVLVGLAAFALLQLVPLPLGWVAGLSPHAAAVWRDALAPFGAAAPSWVTLSVEPAATALEALKWSAYACVLSAAIGARSRQGSEPLALLVFACALLVGVTTLAHGVLDLHEIYGTYPPTDPSRWTRGPFVNGNNLSGYLNLGVFAGAGLWVARSDRYRVVLGIGVLVLAIGSLLAGSRAGTAGLLIGVPVFAFTLLKSRAQSSGKLWVVFLSVALTGIALAGVLGQNRIWDTFGDTQVQAKVSGWRWTLDMIHDFPVFGVGRGAFETAFQPYRAPLGNGWTMVFAHAENFPLEWLADWGVPVGLAALCALGFGLRSVATHATRSPTAAGLATGLGVLLLQNLADLGLELYAVTALSLVAFAGASAPLEPTERTRPWSLVPLLPLLAAVIVIATHASPVQVERRRVASRFNTLAHATKSELLGFQRGLEPLTRSHPGEAYFPLLGGLSAARLGQNPLPWFGRALERSPLDARTHLGLSDALAARGARKQALLHARLAAVYDVTLRDRAFARVEALASTAADLDAAFPEQQPGEGLLPELCAVVRPALVIDCWRIAARRKNALPDSQRGLAMGLVDALEHASPPCAPPAAAECAAEAQRALERLNGQAFSKPWQLATVRARLTAFQGNPGRAAVMLLEHCPATSEAAPCCEQALELAGRSRDLPTVAAAATRYAAAKCGEPNACGAAHERVGYIYGSLGAHGLALAQFTQAAEQSPTVERWLLAAEAAARAGSNVSARLAIDRAAKEGVHDPAQRARVTVLEELLAARQLH